MFLLGGEDDLPTDPPIKVMGLATANKLIFNIEIETDYMIVLSLFS